MIGDASASSKYICTTKKKIRVEGVARSRKVSPGDFLLTNSMSFGRPYIMKTTGCIHDGWLVLSPRSGNVDSDFFFHLLGSSEVYRELSRRASGVTVKNINTTIVSETTVPLPPLPEQKRIAAILDQADSLRRLRQRAIDRLNSLGEAIFREMFGDPLANLMRWDDGKTLGEVAEIVSGITKGRKLNGNATRPVPYLAVVNVQDKELRLDGVKVIEATEEEINRYRLEKNDLLLTEGGDPDKLGRGTLWHGEISECIHQNHVFRVRLLRDEIEPMFLNWLIGSARGKKYFLRSAKQTTGIASINMTQLRGFPLLIPPPDIQKDFSRRLEVLQAQKSLCASAYDTASSLFSSLHHRAFRGEI